MSCQMRRSERELASFSKTLIDHSSRARKSLSGPEEPTVVYASPAPVICIALFY